MSGATNPYVSEHKLTTSWNNEADTSVEQYVTVKQFMVSFIMCCHPAIPLCGCSLERGSVLTTWAMAELSVVHVTGAISLR